MQILAEYVGSRLSAVGARDDSIEMALTRLLRAKGQYDAEEARWVGVVDGEVSCSDSPTPCDSDHPAGDAAPSHGERSRSLCRPRLPLRDVRRSAPLEALEQLSDVRAALCALGFGAGEATTAARAARANVDEGAPGDELMRAALVSAREET
jgi:hypothetical protein